MRPTPLALTNLVLAGGVMIIGLPSLPADFRHLMSQPTVIAIEAGAAADDAGLASVLPMLETAAESSAAAQEDLAFVLLAGSTGGAASGQAGRAAQAFKAYLTRVPGDARGWAGLAQAELIAGDRTAARDALKMSVLMSPLVLQLALWHCSLAIDLRAMLDEDLRRLLEEQFRLVADSDPAALVNLVHQRNALLFARIMLAANPEAMARFEERWAHL